MSCGQNGSSAFKNAFSKRTRTARRLLGPVSYGGMSKGVVLLCVALAFASAVLATSSGARARGTVVGVGRGPPWRLTPSVR